MNLPVRCVCLVAVLAFALLPAGVRADLDSEIQNILADKLLHKSTIGIEVLRLGATPGKETEIYSMHGRTPLIPASNLKLATTSAALDFFGPEFKFRTFLLLHKGDVILVGGGDPTFGDLEYLKKAGWGITTVFQHWADELHKQNVTEVHDVLVDDSVFDQNFTQAGWPPGQYTARFEAEIAGVSLNANCIECYVEPTAPGAIVRYALDPATQYVSIRNSCITGSRNGITLSRPPDSNQITMGGETPSRGLATVGITVHDPPLYAANVLAETLAKAGIEVKGSIQRDRTAREQFDRATAADKWSIVGIHETPLAPILARCNKDSVNLYAESLCKRLGFETAHAPGSWQNGTAAVGAFLKKVGVSETEFHLEDGSGLSRQDQISPHALASVLVYDFHSKNKDSLFNSLSIAGVDGTLDDRFRPAELRDLRRRVFGKSGFIEGVSTVSGYLHAKDNQWYVFSIMINGIPHQSNSEIKVLQEKVIRAVDGRAE